MYLKDITKLILKKDYITNLQQKIKKQIFHTYLKNYAYKVHIYLFIKQLLILPWKMLILME